MQDVNKINVNKNLNMEEIFFKKYTAKENLKNTSWFNEINKDIKIGTNNAFLITGNIYDYVIPGVKLEKYLKNKIVSDLGINNICTFDYVFLNNKHDAIPGEVVLSSIDDRINNIVNMLKFRYREDERKVVIMNLPEVIMPSGGLVQLNDSQRRNLVNIYSLIMSDDFRDSGNLLFIIAENKSSIHPMIYSVNSRIKELKLHYPDESKRKEMIDFLNESCKVNFKLKDIKDYDSLVTLTRGLTTVAIEDIWRKCSEDRCISKEVVLETKRELFKKEFDDFLEIYEPNESCKLDKFGGMKKLKEFLKEGVIEPIQNKNSDMIPKGMLFMGPPGTGKTFLAQCLASESCISFAEIKISKFISKWVGETEQNLEKIFNCIESLSPIFVFIDEIDQVLQRGDEDCNGSRSGIFQMIVNFMSKNEHRGKIIWIGATNCPNKLDEAVKRAGRFDMKLVFYPPINEDEIKEVLLCQIKSKHTQTNINFNNLEFDLFINQLKGYTQAEIDAIITKAINISKRKNREFLEIEHLIEAKNYIKVNDNKKVRDMMKEALKECNDLEFIPKELFDIYMNENNENINISSSDGFDLTEEEKTIILKNRLNNSIYK